MTWTDRPQRNAAFSGLRAGRPARRTRGATAILIAAALSVLATMPAAARDLQDILNEGRLRVGVGLYTPWAMRTEDNELIGFEVDVARQLAADMGVRADVRALPFDDLMPALERQDIDIIAAGLTITPQRAKHANFSNPYAEGGIALATHTANTAAVTGLQDLDAESYTVAVVEESVALDLARRMMPRAKIRVFDSITDASAALVAGEVDAYLEDEPVPTFLALDNPQVVDLPLTQPLLPSPQGFAVRKGDPDFLAYLNAWITARTADTFLPSTKRYWFETVQWRRNVGRRR
jgi:polar amino acid transport system substrate-binding protein